MRLRHAALTILFLAQTTGCYYAMIDTGRPQSVRTVEEAWAPSYVGGMIPPRLEEFVDRCPHGAARVEVFRSPRNMLVTALTLGIYAPSTVQVTCALEKRGASPAPRISAE